MMPEAIAQRIAELELGPRMATIYRRALGPRATRSVCIKAFCLSCQGWEDGAVDAVRNCASESCPLWRVRPYQRREEA